jgi:hypothetical protein
MTPEEAGLINLGDVLRLPARRDRVAYIDRRDQ